jgi:formylglycine-generating enzyme required for sulfatase activity
MRFPLMVILSALVLHSTAPTPDSGGTSTHGEVTTSPASEVNTSGGAHSVDTPMLAKKPKIRWVRIKSGKFEMGSDEYGPVRTVSVRTFSISKSEVTNAQYTACVTAGVCTPPHYDDKFCWSLDGEDFDQGRKVTQSLRGPKLPVTCVDFRQASVFAKWVGARLPSEAEWEFAARSRGASRFPWGDDAATCERAVVRTDGDVPGCGRDLPWPVCGKSRGNTKQGVCDMAGNVMEWVADCWKPSYDGAPLDGAARTSGCSPEAYVKSDYESGKTGMFGVKADSEVIHRSQRDFSWYADPEGVDASLRGHAHPGHLYSSIFVGFRLAK